MSHTTYGLSMERGAWHASCGCGWRSRPSQDLAEQTDELDAHLRGAVTAEQRPGRVAVAATATVLHVVDHTLAVGVLAVCLAVAGPWVARGRAA